MRHVVGAVLVMHCGTKKKEPLWDQLLTCAGTLVYLVMLGISDEVWCACVDALSCICGVPDDGIWSYICKKTQIVSHSAKSLHMHGLKGKEEPYMLHMHACGCNHFFVYQ